MSAAESLFAPQQEPKPTWAVALDKMRDENGNQRVGVVELTSSEAISFVNHYLATSESCDQWHSDCNAAEERLREAARAWFEWDLPALDAVLHDYRSDDD